MFTDKTTQSVAESVRKVMEADLSAKQKKIAAVAGDPKKIDAQDFKKLRGEEVEQMDEADMYSIKNSDRTYHVSRYPITSNHSIYKKIKAADPKAQIHKNGQPVKEEEQIDEAPMKSGAQSRREVDSVMDKYGFGSKQKEAPKSTTRVVAGKSYGADYKDPEGADDADDKKPEAGPKKSVKKGVFKRRYNTKAYTKESFTGLLNDYKDGGVKSLLESLEIVEVEEEVSNDEFDAEVKVAQAKSEGKGKKAEVAKGKEMAIRKEEAEQIDESLDSIANKHGMKYTPTAYGAGMKHPTKGEISINRYGEWHHKGTNKTGDSENSFSSLDKHLSTLKEEAEQMDEDEMTQRKKEQVVTVKHKDSGKELRVVKTAVADYQKRGYHPVKEEVEQMDEAPMKRNLSGFKERYDKGE